MEYFFETVETISAGHGFSQFDRCHLVWLLLFVCFAAGCALLYRRGGAVRRRRMRWTIAALLVADELFKLTILLWKGLFLPKYLPLHLCSINIFLIPCLRLRPPWITGKKLKRICAKTHRFFAHGQKPFGHR